jgi:hypothetical protein
VAPFRTLVAVGAVAALAVPALSGCSNASSEGGATSTSTSSSSSPTAVPSVTVTGTPAVPSVDASRLTAIATCLKNANLPTPTSTEPAAAAAELVRLLRDPSTVAALRACGIPFPAAPTTSTT